MKNQVSKSAYRVATWSISILFQSGTHFRATVQNIPRKIGQGSNKDSQLDPVKVVFCLLLTESVLISRLKQISIQAMNNGVFLYEIYTIMLPTLEEGRVVQFPKADITLHPLINTKSPTS